MTKQEFNDLYLGKAVHCDTEEKANEFLKLAHGFGYKWYSRESLLEINNYYRFQEKTCYNVNPYGITYDPCAFFNVEGTTIVEFKQEKENKMKFKVGDLVTVRSDLEVGVAYGWDTFVSGMTYFEGKQVTIKKVNNGKYLIEEDNDNWNWTDEMLEPVAEFNVGDVVYTEWDDKVTLLELAWRVKFENGMTGFRRFSQLTHQKPLQKITREKLAEKGYELVD